MTTDDRTVAADAVPLPQAQSMAYPDYIRKLQMGFILKKTFVDKWHFSIVYEIWLMDHLRRDSLNLKDNKIYSLILMRNTNPKLMAANVSSW